MTVPVRNYVVRAARKGKPDQYYAIDRQSGGYPCYTEYLSSAYLMTEEEARQVF